MNVQQIKTFFVLIICMLWGAPKNYAQDIIDEHHVKVVLRIVGHEILLSKGDSTSRVLPILKEGNRYKIEFENEFELDPFNWAVIADSVLKEKRIASEYRVEIEKCENNYIVHSFELKNSIGPNEIACRGRILPKGCYSLFITILDTGDSMTILPTMIDPVDNLPVDKLETDQYLFVFIIVSILILGGIIFYFRKKRLQTNTNPETILIGNYQFDKKNMVLYHVDSKITLTSKEADLLNLLYNSANTVLKREDILNAVWGDEGDYIGRTLDVFISKLRKKLSADSNLKIVNIHGVGYKFVVNH